MTTRTISRRTALVRAGLLAGAAFIGRNLVGATASAEPSPAQPGRPFRFCLNTSTLRGQKLGILKEVEVTAAAGYDAIEPWVASLQEYAQTGGSLKDLKKRIADSGLTVEGMIGFPEWVVDDNARRAKGLDQAKREMDLAAQIGARRFAAPPSGATNLPKLDLAKVAERYRALLEAGDQIGLVPELEVWGFSQNLSTLGECVWVAMQTGHPRACVLADIFHLYKGGSDFRGLRLLGPDTVQVLHVNDYPADPPRDKIDDSYRCYPGDGTAPMTEILTALHKTGGQKMLSLELFSKKYWAQDPLEVAKTGLAKMKAAAGKVQIS